MGKLTKNIFVKAVKHDDSIPEKFYTYAKGRANEKFENSKI